MRRVLVSLVIVVAFGALVHASTGGARATADGADLGASLGFVPFTDYGKPKEVPAGGPGRFNASARNFGPAPATGVAVTIALPEHARLVRLVSDGDCSGSHPIVCSVPSLEPNQGFFLDLTVASDTLGPMTLTATVSGDQPDPDPGNNEASQTIEVLASGSPAAGTGATKKTALRIAKFTRGPAKPRAGRRVAATLRVAGSPRPKKGTVICVAKAGKNRLKPLVRKYKNGAANCAWLVPKNAKGQRLTGTVTFRAAGKKLTKTFEAKIL